MKPLNPSRILVEINQKTIEGGSRETDKIRIFYGEVNRAAYCSGAKDTGRGGGLDGGGYHSGLQERRYKNK